MMVFGGWDRCRRASTEDEERFVISFGRTYFEPLQKAWFPCDTGRINIDYTLNLVNLHPPSLHKVVRPFSQVGWDLLIGFENTDGTRRLDRKVYSVAPSFSVLQLMLLHIILRRGGVDRAYSYISPTLTLIVFGSFA
ncbi:hypothetical protein EV421DRAFT_2037624 [Armillaria borealis]|uniref:Uncharacterized protein n=1 Tax=Armillaria borealis TaxID=47425 RepID=A0AA39JAK2_9AGAR|nr:hypothetical protein EV421DRAFT_2037624 [Armillaria borealis]